MKKTAIAVGCALVLGFIGARHLFVGSWLILIPWSIAGLLIGYLGSRDEALINGASYGFLLSLVFLIAGYSGRPSLISRIPIFLVFSAFGGICGFILGLIGHYVRSKTTRHRSTEGKSS